MQIQIPKRMLEWIDNNRGELSRQTFIIKIVEQTIRTTDPNYMGKQIDKEREENSNKR